MPIICVTKKIHRVAKPICNGAIFNITTLKLKKLSVTSEQRIAIFDALDIDYSPADHVRKRTAEVA